MFFKLYGQNITPGCEICEYVSQRPDNTLSCQYKGVVCKGDKCRKFKYDPLKREPRLPKELDKFDDEDFSITTDETES